MDFGERVKGLRESFNLTREELAREFGISYSTLSKYETNGRFPDKDMLKNFADYFDVSLDYLLGRSDVRKFECASNNSDIDTIFNNTKEQLLNNPNILFGGEPACDEAVQSILDAIEIGYKLAKERQLAKRIRG